jgi:hypothetical protein
MTRREALFVWVEDRLEELRRAVLVGGKRIISPSGWAAYRRLAAAGFVATGYEVRETLRAGVCPGEELDRVTALVLSPAGRAGQSGKTKFNETKPMTDNAKGVGSAPDTPDRIVTPPTKPSLTAYPCGDGDAKANGNSGDGDGRGGVTVTTAWEIEYDEESSASRTIGSMTRRPMRSG